MKKDLVCILCPMGCRLHITGTLNEPVGRSFKSTVDNLQVSGNTCKRGITYANDEITNPVRTVCTTARINGGMHPVIPVKTDKPIQEKFKLEVVKAVNEVTLTSPVKMGDVIISNLFGTGVNVVAESDM